MSIDVHQNIPRVDYPLVDARGNISEQWFLFFVALFQRTGAGIGIDPNDALALGVGLSGTRGAELSRVVADVAERDVDVRNYGGRVADLERRVAVIEGLLQETRVGRVDLTQIRRDLDQVLALTVVHG
jgi:hypothetical protein